MNDWMIDEWDVIGVECGAVNGDCDSVERNELIMKSMIDDMLVVWV